MIDGGSAWALPGPSRLVGEICAALYRERVGVVRTPHGPAAVAGAVERRLNDDGLVRVFVVPVEPGRAPLDAVADVTGARPGAPAALVTAPELAEGAVLLLPHPDAAPDAALADFARLASRPGDRSAPLLLVLGDARAAAVSGGRPRELRGVAGPLDAAAHLASLAIDTRTLAGRVAAAVAMETAAWDIGLLDRLATMPLARAVRPDESLSDWTDARAESWRGAEVDWAAGSLEDWGGERCEHPLWLAANRPDLLRKRVWRGQVAVLLPWIEQRRLELIARFQSLLRPDPDRCGPDLEALDWGPLRQQLRGRDDSVTELAEAFRVARNELAHGRPLAWPAIERCMRAADPSIRSPAERQRPVTRRVGGP